MICIHISKDYSKIPGGRYIKDGPFSGEEFRETILRPKFLEAKQQNTTLQVNLDGGYGYGSSFLEEAFGGLARELKDPAILRIEIISEEETILISQITKYIEEGLKG
ncbi:MAG: DUF4325 domain-containing protein [Bacillota bacterium]|nr:DUF4325 domain-containing protein [Bacillota bacterium]